MSARTNTSKGRGARTSEAPATFGLWRDRVIIAAIAVLSSIAGIANGFVFDDVPQVAENVRVQGLSRIGEILTLPYWPPPYAPELFRPVASLTVALQYVLGAGDATTFRVVSYLLYALAAVCVFELTRRLVSRPVALGIAALFAADPLHVEAVALAVNQGELIVACAAVLSVILYVDRRRGNSGAGSLGARDWTALCALFVVAALAKENGFVLPGLIVAADLFLIDGGPVRDRLRVNWHGYAAMALVGVLLLVWRAIVLSGRVTGALPAKAIAGLSLGGRLLTMLQIVPKWVRLLAWPAHLQIDYSPNEIVASTGFGAHELLGLVLLIAFAAIAWMARRRAPIVTFGLAWCAIALFPVSNIVPTGIVLAERTLFLPSVGFLIAVGGVVAFALSRSDFNTVAVRRSLAGVCALIAVLGVARSDRRQLTWNNGQAMWAAAAIDAPRSLRVKQAHEEAIADLVHDFERAAQSSPTPWRVRFELGTLLRFMNADSTAATQLRASLSAHPEQADVALELSATLISLGEYVDAKKVATSVTAGGDTARVAQRFAQLADSADKAHAPAGSIRVVARGMF